MKKDLYFLFFWGGGNQKITEIKKKTFAPNPNPAIMKI